MGSNDTLSLGLHRPSAASRQWFDGADEDLNQNFTVLDALAAPSGGSGKHQTRIVAKSFAGLTLPATTKLFDSINDAISDVTAGNEWCAPIFVYPGVYEEELVIRDRSVHIIGLGDHPTNRGSENYVSVRSNKTKSGQGKPCITIQLRTGEDRNNPTGQSIWGLTNKEHDTRRKSLIMFSNIYFDNDGGFQAPVAHDSSSTYFVDCTDGGTPPYFGHYTWLAFNNCVFRGQTWHDYATDNTSVVAWYQYGFRLKAFSLRALFKDCDIKFLNYGGGTFGQSGFLTSVKQPFYVGTDGTSFINWTKGPPGATDSTNPLTGNAASDRYFFHNRAEVWFDNCSVYVTDGQGTFNCPGYTGNGWNYGPGSDTSHAIFTLENMGHLNAESCQFNIHVFGTSSRYVVDFDRDGIQNSNWVTIFTNGALGNSVEGDFEATAGRADHTVCSSAAFDIQSMQRVGGSTVMFNKHRNFFGEKEVKKEC